MQKIRVRNLILISSLLALSVANGYGLPAKPGIVNAQQPDGSIVEIYLSGNENSHLAYSVDNYLLTTDDQGYYVFADIDEKGDIIPTKFRDINLSARSASTGAEIEKFKAKYGDLKNLATPERSKIKREGPGLSPSRFPISGEQKSIVILVDFPNKSFSIDNPRDYYTRMLNEEGFSEQYGTGSARDYFISNSSGAFIPEFVVYGPVTLPNDYSYYGANYWWGSDIRPEEMVIDACNILDDEVDFSEYDRNGDGFIDNVYLFYAGYGEADGGGANTVWPHSWDITSVTRIPYVYDGVRLDHYACSNELQNRSILIDGIGSFCHEFCHVLGLPDLYATSYTNAFTPGNWDLLDKGSYNNSSRTPPNLSAFERYALDWMAPLEVHTGDVELDPIDVSNQAYIIKTENENEYFLIENRQQQGFDTYIPGHGMLAWHIDYDSKVWINNSVNNNASHQYVDLMEADNAPTAQSRGGDSFPGTRNVTELSSQTLPGLVSWKGVESPWAIYDIEETKDGVIKFKVKNMEDEATELLEGTPIGSSPESAMLAFDGDENTSYLANQASYSWVGLDLGDPHVIKKVEWTAPSNNPGQVLLGVFQGANNEDFSDAVPIALIDNASDSGKDVDCSRGFRFVRYVGPANSYCNISELQFFGYPGEGNDSRLWQVTNLPTFVINTVDGEIPYDKEHDISSTVIIISENGTDVLEKSETSIRERGNASRQFPKKPWRIKFDKKQNVLDAPAKAKKWTLINNYGDKTLMRNLLAFDIARAFDMDYVPYCAPVDVILNGEYKGCYQLCDQVEINEGRLDIVEMGPEDNEGEALTGGYFVEVDGYADEEPVWFTTSLYKLPITIKSPDDEEITDEQRRYIEDYFNSFEALLRNSVSSPQYREVFDVPSFIRHMLVNELAGNPDIYWSVNMYKDRTDPKIYTGPVWDFDLAFNNDFRCYPVTQRSGNGYLWNTNSIWTATGMQNVARLIISLDPETAADILNIWSSARSDGLTPEWLESKIDEYGELLARSQRLNFLRWPILSTKVHNNPVALGSYEAECDAIRNFVYSQFHHLDEVIGYPIDDESTVPDVEMIDENTELEYYTLTGIRVTTPTLPGIYVVKSGSRSKKIIIK